MLFISLIRVFIISEQYYVKDWHIDSKTKFASLIEFTSRIFLTLPSFYVFYAFYFIVRGTYKIHVKFLNSNLKNVILNENDILKNKFEIFDKIDESESSINYLEDINDNIKDLNNIDSIEENNKNNVFFNLRSMSSLNISDKSDIDYNIHNLINKKSSSAKEFLND